MTHPTFSGDWDAPFRSSPFWLRFELGGELFGNDAPVPRFVQAFSRARDVADEVFQLSRQLFAIVASPPCTAQDLFAPAEDGFQALCDAGFARPCIAFWKAPLWLDQGDEDQISSEWRAFDLSDDAVARDVLLWCAVSYEMAISPKAPIVSYLVDFERRILVHVYDDRGMDVTALERDHLLPVYLSRQNWLLD